MDLYDRIYDLVREVPPGKVTTYGQVGAMCGLRDIRIVGEAMNASHDVPWQRVINSQGRISERPGAEKQRKLLEAEGIVFVKDRVDLKKFGWKGLGEADLPPQQPSLL